MEVVRSNLFAFDQIDDASAALILQLQHEDADELQRLDKGKACEGTVSDADLALQVYQYELQQTSTVLADRCMSRSLAKAVIADSAFLTDAVAREDAFAHDRLVAERLHSGEEVDCGTEGCSEDPQLDDLLIARLTALYVSGTDDDCTASSDDYQDVTTGESSQWAAARADTSKTTRHESVHVAHSSATSVEHVGKIVGATNGTKTVSSLAQNRLSHASNRSEPCPPQSKLSRCSRLWRTSAIDITAPTTAGAGFGGPISAKNATTTSRSTFSSAGNAKLGLAIAVREIGCEKPAWTDREGEDDGKHKMKDNVNKNESKAAKEAKSNVSEKCTWSDGPRYDP
ncbi:MAG: hypothetical protein Q9182_006815 [Xanthomendoza sp. 2 TL-2023]